MSKKNKSEKVSGKAKSGVDNETSSEMNTSDLEGAQPEVAPEGKDPSADEISIEKQLAASQEEVAELKDRMLRLAADYENYKKRSERDRALAMKYAGEYIFKDILPVVDNLERALTQGIVEGAEAEKNLSALMEGVELTLKSLTTNLEKFEVKAIDCVGAEFDPNVQEALTMEPSDTIPTNHVVTEFEKGYFYKDRLLRAAKVTVSSGKAES